MWLNLSLIILQASATIYHQYRSDVLLDYNQYPEDFSKPTGGGRIHYVIDPSFEIYTVNYPLSVTLTVSGQPITISLTPSSTLPSQFNWIHCDVSNAKRIWVSLHTGSDDVAKNLQNIIVQDANGDQLVNAPLPLLVKDYSVKITYVTSSNNYTNLIVHIHNYDNDQKQISNLTINGVNTQKSVLIQPGEHLVFEFPVNTFEGDVWTVGFYTNNDIYVGNGGRLGKEYFPMEVWQHSSSCPFPETNDANFKTFTQNFLLDTFYLYNGGTCNGDPNTIIQDAPNYNYYLLVDKSIDDLSKNPSNLQTMSKAIAGVFIADENDGNPSNAQEAWQNSMHFRLRTPSLLTYQGGKTYSWAGTFSGITDIQGKDFYVAGCAPHITTFSSTMRIQGAHDYLFNTRENHKPLPVWGYSQFIGSWHNEPNANEIIVQLASVIAAGNKGLMLFQVDQSYAGSSWLSTVIKCLKPIQLLRDDLRLADVEGAIWKKDDDADSSIVAVLRAPTKLIVVAINTKCDTYNDVLCSIGVHDHWDCHQHGISNLYITLPSDLQGVSQVTEATESGIGPTNIGVQIGGGQVHLSNIGLDDQVTARFFIIS